ncbi:APC family permease [Sulfuracidifex metallicus]|uniref:Amino acid permease n=1 Tax=Sulfuracidifex metallicus DSM 6482 = JCM 9184 TaxID=523847 RepID=A0A6A9QVM7_SULME|nr:APC family permease [Sulfuracidifex metallicus]MUN29112.1 amino acid permease [Sulfuracidifex metallicus DSM 6482 = JCM 9184]
MAGNVNVGIKDNPNFKKEAGLISLIAFSLGNIIGSGILLLPAVTASLAGPLSPAVWLVGGILLLPVVVVYSKLAKMFPLVGSKIRFINITHGKVMASSVGWLYMIGTLLTIPVEAEATVNYLSYIFPSLMVKGYPTIDGYLVESLIVISIYLLVYLGIRGLSISVNTITYAKLAILLIYVISVAYLDFHVSNFTINFSPSFSNFLYAIALTMFAYGGFRSAMVYAGESKADTGKAIMIAFGLSMILYTLIPLVFIGSLSSSVLSSGWGAVGKMSAPLAESAIIAGVPALGALFILDGVISPSGASLIGAGDMVRYSYALTKTGSFPKALGKVDQKRGIPILPVAIFGAFSLLTLFFSATFEQSIGYLVATRLLAYSTGPVSLYLLTNDSRNRTLSLISFLVTGLIFSFVGFPKTLFGTAVILVALLAMLPFSKNYVPALWYLGFSAVITFITFLSIPSMISLPIVILVSAVFFYLAVKTGKGDGEVDI